MKKTNYNISLLDVPEVLPFKISSADGGGAQGEEKADKELFRFISELEKEFSEELYYIGWDKIGGKFYRRFLFEEEGFLEVSMTPPCAIVAHFHDKNRAHLFARALKDAVLKTVGENILTEMLVEDINITKGDEGGLTQYKLSELREIRTF